MTAARYALEPAAQLGSGDIETLRRIYEDGFPAHQRSDFATLIDSKEDGEFALALMRGPQPCGFAMLRELGPSGWVYLRYFVVDTRHQGQGLGGIMWDQLTARLAAAGSTLLVFDVEDPAEAGRDAVKARTRLRRIAFYERHGASVLPVSGYRTPGSGPDHQGWTPMLLMTAPLAGRPSVTSPDQADAIVSAVYRYRWQLSPEHPQVKAVQPGIYPAGGASRGTGTGPGPGAAGRGSRAG